MDLAATPIPLFVESTAKYLCHYVSGGVLYGDRTRVEQARQIARTTGQQLQAAAFSYFRTGELAAAPLRMRIHTRNLELLLSNVGGEHGLDMCAAAEPNRLGLTSVKPLGCVIYLRVDAATAQRHGSRALAHRKLMRLWRERSEALGQQVDVRAGYGWDRTSVRCYEGDSLKQKGVEEYMRISVGTETPRCILRLSQALLETLKEIIA